jgi:GxxExxY protein
MYDHDPLTEVIIGEAIAVSKFLRNGLLENAYHLLLVHRLRKINLDVRSQPTMPVVCDGICIESAYRPDIIVNNQVIVELKTVKSILPVHKAQLLTYMRFAEVPVGLLINFHAYPFSKGIIRMVL